MINISLILIEPENPGNTGAICRAMKNFDFENLILINPKFDTESTELRNRAKWANDLVDKIKIIKKYDKNTIKNLHKKFDYLITTTARVGRDFNILRSPMTPHELAEKLSELKISSKKGPKIAIIIGRESIGLTNEEIEQSDFSVTIPASKNYGTMNISHATTIILYEIFKKNSTETLISHISPITDAEKKQMFKLLEETLDSMDFLNEQKKDTQRTVWKKMINKSFLSRREAYALMGFFKKIRKIR